MDKRYLVSPEALEYLQPYVAHAYKECSYFCDYPDHRLMRYTCIDDTTYLKVLQLNNQTTEIIEKVTYQAFQNYRLGNMIVQEIYEGCIKGVPFVLHNYQNELKGICILRTDSTMPQDMHHLIQHDISRDERYDEVHLALYPKPLQYDITRYLHELQSSEPVNLFFWQVPSNIYTFDGLVLLLQKNALLLRYYAEGFVKKPNMAYLHRFRILIRRTRTLLNSFRRYLQASQAESISTQLLTLYEETKTLRYLYFIDDLFTLSDDKTVTFYTYLQQTIDHHITLTIHAMQSDRFMDVLYRLLAMEPMICKNDYLLLSQTAPQSIYDAIHRFKKLLSRTNPDKPNLHADHLFHALDDIQTLMEDFNHIIGQKRLIALKDEIDVLFEPLREFKNCQERKKILIDMQGEHPQCKIDSLLCTDDKQRLKRLTRAIKIMKTCDLTF